MVTRWSSRGTHRGEFRGIAPTGNEVVESWDNFDQLGMLQQLGTILSQEQSAG